MPLSTSSKFKSMFSSLYARITLNRMTAAFFVFGFIHCFAQGIMHSFLFSIDSDYDTLLSGIVAAAQFPDTNHTYITGSSGNYVLHDCNFLPHTPANCTTIFDSHKDVVAVTDISQDSLIRGQTVSEYLHSGLNITPVLDSTDPSTITGVDLRGRDGSTVLLNDQCTSMLSYPQHHMRNALREDFSLVLFQFWLFTISVIALVYDSIPHVLAGLFARALVTGWSIYAIWRTKYREGVYHQLIAVPGTPCSVELFDAYFGTRIAYEIPDLLLNCTALILSSYLSWALLKMYSKQSFKYMGAPEHITRIYKLFMAVQACLQLEVFVLLTAMGLWVDSLFNTYIRNISAHTSVYEALFVSTTILLVPWIAMGWFAIRREMRTLMLAFLGISFFFITGWSVMFYSQIYRWMFIDWPYMAIYTVASFILIIASGILGVICRMNFGKGLAQYLHAEEALASMNFAPEVFEHDVEKNGMSNDFKSPVSPGGPQIPTPTYYLPSLHHNRNSAQESVTGVEMDPRTSRGRSGSLPKYGYF